MTELVDQLLAAQKFGSLQDIETKLEDLKRQSDAAVKDAGDARSAAARVKAEADAYYHSKKAEADTATKKTTANIQQMQDSAQVRLANMEANAQAAVDAIAKKLEEKRKELAEVSAELERYKDELGELKSSFQDAWNALGH